MRTSGISPLGEELERLVLVNAGLNRVMSYTILLDVAGYIRPEADVAGAAPVEPMENTILHSFSDLDRQVVVSWKGCEMALSENGAWVLDDAGIESFRSREVQWTHPAVPYLQMTEVVLSLADGRTFSLLSQQEDGTGVHGLYLISGLHESSQPTASAAAIFRARELVELPKGAMQVSELHRDGANNVIELVLRVDSSVIRLLSGEVYEREGNRFEIVEVDESILIQVDGKSPCAPGDP